MSQPPGGVQVGERAVVLGGSIAGLFAGQVLAEAYREVVVVDRDRLFGVTGTRRATPQAFHAHALLARGQRAIEELFPGITEESRAAGVPTGDVGADLRWVINGQRLPKIRTGLVCLAIPRTALEQHVRKRVRALPNVTFLEGRDVEELVTTRDRGRVTGVRILHQRDGSSEVLPADLVVDATGRGSRLPVWLAELGYQPPAEEQIKIRLSYTTRHYRLPPGALGTDLAYIVAQTPSHPRGAVFARERALPNGGDRYVLSLNAHLGDHAPTEPDGFLAYARTVPVPEIHHALRTAEPLDEIRAYQFPTSLWRHYERLTRFPDGLLVLGDALASPNPVYAQGNTITAVEALVLRDHLRRGAEPRPAEFFADVAPTVRAAWDINVLGDLAYPQVVGERTPRIRLACAYLARVHRAVADDPVVAESFLRVAGLIDGPQALLRPRMLARVLGRRHPAPRPTVAPAAVSS
ncbi:FAD-dependent oxidoreductase [Plantactinospora soyae]|uniref:2-polyprenyl-6-methoxyphenol hydroxylase-like FAD-dependent oxidoreductase n=1 Tax=Plantactinospora soyae TaxID=1544732 RepID=A0A927QZF8_9ACTN|nr:FAD-dependent oxidoreductase [Plantactinospora soyae]MBE1487558.1 2-polyprenyl-6-methoxyphenol hydroxylase-like FAD-dependent oxidoreductase [Plantactinospora soyae]